MREDLLQYVWRYQKLPVRGGLSTSGGQSLRIVNPGQLNRNSGPDFFNAKLEIGGQLWAGNVEIHVKASGWYRHNHQDDPAYDNVILHVVWEEDVPVYREDQTRIPAIELKDYIQADLLAHYRRLFDKGQSRFINCENQVGHLDARLISMWLERLYLERLETKALDIESRLHASQNDWEQVLFMYLLKNFGLNVNGDTFFKLAQSIDFSIIRKIGDKVVQLESLLFGVSGLLDGGCFTDKYLQSLREEYMYLKRRFGLKSSLSEKPEFARLRPLNFPTIRLSQFAVLYGTHPRLFSNLMEAESPSQIYSLFSVGASSYWDSHFVFGVESRHRIKMLSRSFIDLLLINTVLPIKFCYERHRGRQAEEGIIRILARIPAEKNRIVTHFCGLGVTASDARDSQAILQLYNEYCTRNRCLQCAVGCRILSGK